MPERLVLHMRDPRKAPYDVPLLVKTERGYCVAERSDISKAWHVVSDSGVIWEGDGECGGLIEVTPIFYCDLPR